VLPLAVEVLEAETEDEGRDDETTIILLLVDEGVELELVESDELAPKDVELDPSNDGGGTAVLGSTSLPTPQGMESPEGCFELAGGVEEPVGD